MEGSRFDDIARLLGGASSRRAGLKAALGVLAGLAPLSAAARGGPSAQGPCGSGSVKDNRCTRNRQCCTNICERDVKNKDKKGRCRCQKRGESCTEDRNCCVRGGQQISCIGGICTDQSCTPPDTCEIDGDCCPGQFCDDKANECRTPCNATTCANGCCTGDFCVTVANQPAEYGNCGTGGVACTQCNGSCAAGVCTPGVPTGSACTSGGLVCADFQATCTTYTGGSPAGTFCLLQNGLSCTAPEQCVGQCCSGFACC